MKVTKFSQALVEQAIEYSMTHGLVAKEEPDVQFRLIAEGKATIIVPRVYTSELGLVIIEFSEENIS